LALLGITLLAITGACGPADETARANQPSEIAEGWFIERALGSGIKFKMAFLPGEQGENFKINLYDHGAGVVVGDIDGDGFDDLYFLNQLGANALFLNKGDGTFADVTKAAGPVALADRICTAGAFNDIDNDGDQDLYVCSTRGGNVLFLNDGQGRFRDVTDERGVAWIGHSQGLAFFDAENDGDLDLLVTNTARWTTDRQHPRDRYYEGHPDLWGLVKSPIEHNVYFRNDGTGRFTDATRESALGGKGWGGDIAVFDYDDDGDSDLFVANMFGQSALYRNDGKGQFADVTDDVMGATPFGTVGARAFDYDGDGRLDLYLVDMHSDMWMPLNYEQWKIKEHEKYSSFIGRLAEDPAFTQARKDEIHRNLGVELGEVFFGNGLYRNKGDGTFEEVSDKSGAETFWPWGIAAGDFDNNRYVDAFLPSGMGYPYFFWRNNLLMNDGTGKFTDRSRQAGIDPPPGGPVMGKIGGKPATRSARSAAVLDIENDGRLDVAVNNFNDNAHLYANRWPARGFIGFRLEGTRSNRDAIGAVVRIYAGNTVQVRLVQAAGGYLGQSSKTVHFGLGDTGKVDRAEIRWPSGHKQTIKNPSTGQIHAVREPKEG
jgi:hypothetical protein